MSSSKLINVKDLSDDVLCAIVARNEVRKEGKTPGTSPSTFGTIFHEYADYKKSSSEEQEAKIERARKKKLHNYLVDNFNVKIIKGQLVGTIDTE